MLPLVDGHDTQYSPGWCSYLYRHAESPEVEVFCGGINSKTAKAAGLWRQGNLLHFGFEQSPAELNATGRALLINSVVYIARFREDRAIAKIVSPFVGPSPHDRAAIHRALTRPDFGLPYLKIIVAEPLYKEMAERSNDERLAWYRQFEGFLHGNEEGRLVVDEDAVSFGAPPNSPQFFDKAIAALAADKDVASQAARLLERYAPDGPGENSSAAAWKSWLLENKPYLFFSDCGGYRWYIDALAKQRAIPSARLRGPARADRQKARSTAGSRP